MDELVKKVRRILGSAFPQSTLDIRDDDGIIGVLVSPTFEGLASIDRQDMIWDALDRNLEPDEKRQIQIIVAATPEEHMGHLATP
jgi:acid stress-induced BolA-like protein IbaG/YrbA